MSNKKRKPTIKPHHFSECGAAYYGRCLCAEPVRQAENGNWFITAGHAGFKTPQNQGSGWKLRSTALRIHKRGGK